MRAVRRLLIVLVVFGVLLVAADRAAVAFAETEVAERAQRSQGLSTAPDVEIHGFPFLTQVVGKNLEKVTAVVDGAEAGTQDGTLRIERITTELHDVRLKDNYSSAVAATATGTALISYADLGEAAPDGVSVAYGGKGDDGAGRVKVTLSLSVLGRSVEHSLNSRVSVRDGNTFRLRAEDIPVVDGVPGLEGMVRERIDMDRKLGGLPAGITMDGVRATEDGIVISLKGTDVRLA
ncbi:DUF2993 domain-containing protein [Streptomyces sp. SCUT-3]|nr:DUF2993 domain-containing protein [Streptomyces sp. DJ]QMV22245.1 DUF2993 domain-containing protein [Streptomyces sp. SCUT-3]